MKIEELGAHYSEIFDDWKIPDNLHEKAYSIIRKFGLTFVSEIFPYHETYTDQCLDEFEKELESYVMFEARDWYQLTDILCEIFEFQTIIDYNLYDEKDLINKIIHKELLNFYEDQEDKKSPKQVLCCQGYKMKDAQREWVMRSYQKWKANQVYWSKF